MFSNRLITTNKQSEIEIPHKYYEEVIIHMAKTVRTTRETKTGRNTEFRDKNTEKNMTRSTFVKEIKKGNYSGDYHVRVINGVSTPVSNPDKSKGNNLG